MKKRLFIGSSSEELALAERARVILEPDFDVVVWNENIWDRSVFKINQNFLSDLLKATLKFDFGILIGTKDDEVIYRKKKVLQPRDNVLFELGLFTGRLGTAKCAFLVDKDLKVLSDLQGISLARFDTNEPDTFDTAVGQIRAVFKTNRDGEINFFPSVTLSAVYFKNLILPICRFIIEKGGFEVEGTTYKDCKIKVIIPPTITSDVNLQFEKLKGTYNTKVVEFNYAGRPRKINIDSTINNGILEFIDFPTILAGINHAILIMLPDDFNNLSPDYEQIMTRELDRFVSNLKLLLLRHGFDDIVEVVKVEAKK